MPVPGDVWSFVPPDAVLTADAVWGLLGDVPTGDYHIVLTGVIAWSDPVPPQHREIHAAIDLDGFDAAGNILADWDSGIYARLNEGYDADGVRQHSRAVAVQSVVSVPAGTTLKLMRQDQSGVAQPSPIEFREGRLVVTAVTPAV